MAFRFPLATLLRLREIAEEREERALGRLLSEMAQVRHSLSDLQTQRINLIQTRERCAKLLISSAELQSSYGQVAYVERRQAEVRDHLTKLELLRVEQLRRYEIAHRDREVLSGMREEQLDTYRREQTRQEQNSMDDNFSSRRSLR